MKTTLHLSLFIAAGLLGSCGHRSAVEPEGTRYHTEYASGFEILRAEEYTSVTLRNPWDTTRLLARYILVPGEATLPDDLPDGQLLRTPLKKVVVYSSVHCGFLNEIGVREEIAGVCESRYIDFPFIRKGIADGSIVDVGEAVSPNVEMIIQPDPDALITSPIENMGYGAVLHTGIPLVEATDYMEHDPLGRAEWIRFFGLLFDRESLADSIFTATVHRYDSIKSIAGSVTARPTVLPELKYGAVWYVPAGDSYMARLYRDAGADYPWSDHPGTGSLPLSFENVLERGVDADVWIFKYNRPEEMGYADLQNEYEGYGRFKAFRERSVYAANSGKVPFYEELPIHPDYVLEDLVWIFHPERMPDYRPRYFRRLENH